MQTPTAIPITDRQITELPVSTEAEARQTMPVIAVQISFALIAFANVWAAILYPAVKYEANKKINDFRNVCGTQRAFYVYRSLC